LLNHT